MKRLAGLSALALIISSTSGCGWIWGDEGYFRDRGSDYQHEQRSAPMQLPAGVEARPLDPLLPIPDRVADAPRVEKYEVPRPQAMSGGAEVNAFSLQKSGDSRWLLAQRSPAEVWPLVRQFLDDNGFRVAEERPQTGEFITEWQRPEQLSSAMASRLRTVDGESRLRVRVEPGVQRDTSEIFLVSAQRPVGSSAEVEWPSTASTLDASMLDDMLASAVRSGEEGGSVSLLAARDYDAPQRVNLASDGSGNPVLTLDTDLNRAWSSVGRALEKSDIRVDDLNRSLGLYYVNLAEGAQKDEDKPGFFARLTGKGEKDQAEIDARAERYQVRLTEVSGSVQVTVEKDINTVAPAEVARRILGLVQNNLG
jgi:outer membrane protein assembly factor BamC